MRPLLMPANREQPFTTPQEQFWAGDFGNAYVDRSRGAELEAYALGALSRMLSRAHKISSAIEFGANVGLNVKALRRLLPHARLEAVEINAKACAELRRIDGVTAHNMSLLDYKPAQQVDLAYTAGVLIHINPDALPQVYQTLYETSRRYILIAEYYSPAPVALQYRGHAERLFKRDWAGEIMATYGDLSLVDYGFLYHRDPMVPWDDTNWFLLAKP